MEILNKLPIEILNKIFLFMRHPIAELINNSIIDEECDDDRFRLLYAICHFYNSTKYNKYICVKVYNYN
jgi:hypothetical protein